MSRTTATLSVSLPPEMAEEVDRVRRSEHRTRSELVREALRKYIRDADIERVRVLAAALPEEEPTAEEIEAIVAARGEFRAGRHKSFRHLHHELHSPGRRSGAKKP
ncbi:MAG: ribbon-helix-helix domain-containing protein [Alphaproteobacteria bacterium]